MKKRSVLIIVLLVMILVAVLIYMFLGRDKERDENIIQKQQIFKIGDYIILGKYLDEPVLWRVVNLDEDYNAFLFSEHIITFKAFDAAESGQWDKGDDYIQKFGSSRWKNSNLREWLNSNSAAVQYSTQPPVIEALEYNINPYADEPGFLSNFTQAEQNAIKPVTHPVVLDKIYMAEKAGGEEPFNDIYDIPSKSISNEASAYHENSTDRIFLLSIQELAEWVEGNSFESKREATEAAIRQVEEKRYAGVEYWLRTPTNEEPCFLSTLNNEGYISYRTSSAIFGVCPILLLDIEKAEIESGTGSSDEPYIIMK